MKLVATLLDGDNDEELVDQKAILLTGADIKDINLILSIAETLKAAAIVMLINRKYNAAPEATVQ